MPLSTAHGARTTVPRRERPKGPMARAAVRLEDGLAKIKYRGQCPRCKAAMRFVRRIDPKRIADHLRFLL
jgi:hypothetical protein